MEAITHRVNPLYDGSDEGGDGDAVVINMEPAKQSSSSKSEKRNSKIGQASFMDNADYLETLVIGGGTAWIFALYEVILTMMKVSKQFGIPFAGQAADILKALGDFPLSGALLRLMCGAVTRTSYIFSGFSTSTHPAKGDVWTYSLDNGSCLGLDISRETIEACSKCSNCNCVGCCVALIKAHKGEPESPPVAPDRYPFPETVGALRGTPMHKTVSKFDNAIFGNERGNFLDLAVNGKERGFSMRVKTGNTSASNPGEVVFQMAKNAVPWYIFLFNLLLCFAVDFRKYCTFSCDKNEDVKEVIEEGAEKAKEEIEKIINNRMIIEKKQGAVLVYSASGKNIGAIRQSKQKPNFCDRLFRNRFTARDFPLYDIIDANGDILYTVIVPVKKFNTCCLPPSYYDEDFFLIVEGTVSYPDLTSEPTPWAEAYSNFGWVVPVTPKYEKFVDQCMERSKLLFTIFNIVTCSLCTFFKFMFECCMSCAKLVQTCPIDNVTQVPWPDHRRPDLRATTMCSHGLSANRIALPGSVSREHRMLFMGLSAFIEMDGIFRIMGAPKS